MSEEAIPTKTITSQEEKASELTTLTAQKGVLEKRQEGWEIALSIALLVTAVAAFLVFVFDWRLRKASKAIQEVQEDIIRAKDAELQLSLREKDHNLETEKLKRAEIEESLAWRRLAPNDFKKFSQLSHFRGKTVQLAYNGGDAEALNFAWELARVFNDEYKLKVFAPAMYMESIEMRTPLEIVQKPPTNTGVFVESTSDRPSLQLATAILKGLHDSGFDAMQPKSDGNPKAAPMVEVWVVTRPLGPQGEAKLKAEHKKK